MERNNNPVDPTRLTDADWAALNKLRDAHQQGGQKALRAAMKEIEQADLVTYVRIISAYFPVELRAALKDAMAERGMTAENLRQMIRESEEHLVDQSGLNP